MQSVPESEHFFNLNKGVMFDPSKTAILIEQSKQGDKRANEQLAEYVYPTLLSWAHGRVPRTLDSLIDTSDVVQETLVKGMEKLNDFQSLRPGAFLAYLRRIFINNINQKLRSEKPTKSLEEIQIQQSKLILKDDIEELVIYEEALSKLNPSEQDIIILRVEFGMSFKEIAGALDKNTEDAARMQFNRALGKLLKYITL